MIALAFIVIVALKHDLQKRGALCRANKANAQLINWVAFL